MFIIMHDYAVNKVNKFINHSMCRFAGINMRSTWAVSRTMELYILFYRCAKRLILVLVVTILEQYNISSNPNQTWFVLNRRIIRNCRQWTQRLILWHTNKTRINKSTCILLVKDNNNMTVNNVLKTPCVPYSYKYGKSKTQQRRYNWFITILLRFTTFASRTRLPS